MNVTDAETTVTVEAVNKVGMIRDIWRFKVMILPKCLPIWYHARIDYTMPYTMPKPTTNQSLN